MSKKMFLTILASLFLILGVSNVKATTWYALDYTGTGTCLGDSTNRNVYYNYSTVYNDIPAISLGRIGTTYNGILRTYSVVAQGDSTNIHFMAGSQYRMRLYTQNYDLTSNWSIDDIQIKGFYPIGNESVCSSYNNTSSISYTVDKVVLSNLSGSYYSIVDVYFTATGTRDYVYFYITDSSGLTGVSNWSFNSRAVYLEQQTAPTDATNEDIINANDKNTESIIQSNENNTNNIINTLTDLFKEQADKQEQIENTLTDETPPSVDGLDDMAGWLPAGPVDSILNLPLSLFNNLSNSLSSTCEPVSLPLPYVNKNIELPCVNSLYEQMGILSFLNWIGGIASAFMLFGYFMHLYKWVDDTLTLRENTWNDTDQWGGV